MLCRWMLEVQLLVVPRLRQVECNGGRRKEEGGVASATVEGKSRGYLDDEEAMRGG